MKAIWRVITPSGEERLCLGEPSVGPEEVLEATTKIDDLYTMRAGDVRSLIESHRTKVVAENCRILAPVNSQEIWAAGVTYQKSLDARSIESARASVYEAVYSADRPELFLKQAPGRVRDPGAPIGVRADSAWDVPEPELAVAFNRHGEAFAYTIGNDVSSRSIEGENPLYLPQAKIFRGSCSLGPCLVPYDSAPRLDDMTIKMSICRGVEEVFQGEVSLAKLMRAPEDLADYLFLHDDFPVGLVLLTGTGLVPEDFTLEDGDLVEIGISHLGTLVNPVVRSEARKARYAV